MLLLCGRTCRSRNASGCGRLFILLQRAYDQILHDVCIQNLHVVFAIDRSGLVGADGSTHQGIFDITYLSGIPNMTILSPKNRYELEDALDLQLVIPDRLRSGIQGEQQMIIGQKTESRSFMAEVNG